MRAPWLAIGAIASLALPGVLTPARADELVIYPALSCDAAANRALLRFGYADDDDRPVFPPLPNAPSDDLSRWPVPAPRSAGDDAREVSCRFDDGRELKARLGYGPASSYGELETARWIFSLWLDKRKIVSRAPAEPPDCGEDCSVHSVLIEHDTTRRCDFHGIKDGNLLDLAAHPAPIVCAAPVAVTGMADPIEYPPPGAPEAPRVGSMLITSLDADPVCRALVRDEAKAPYATGESRDVPSDAPSGSEVVSLHAVGGAFTGYKPLGLPGFHNGAAEVATLDFANDGAPRRVYHVSGENHYFYGDLFVATDADIPEEPVAAMLDRELSPEGDVEAIATLARARGWFAVTGDDAPYKSIRYTHFWLFRFAGSTYLLAVTGDLGDPTAVVLKPMQRNQLRTECVFQTVRANF